MKITALRNTSRGHLAPRDRAPSLPDANDRLGGRGGRLARGPRLTPLAAAQVSRALDPLDELRVSPAEDVVRLGREGGGMGHVADVQSRRRAERV